VGQQVEQEGVFTGRRGLDQLDQLGRLLGGQRQRRDAEGGAFGRVLAIGLQLVVGSCGTVEKADRAVVCGPAAAGWLIALPVTYGLIPYFMSYIRLAKRFLRRSTTAR